MKYKLVFLVMLFSMLLVATPSVSAFEWCEWIPFWDCETPTILTDHTIFNEELNVCSGSRSDMLVSVSPCKVQDLDGKDIVQYVDFKWEGIPKNVSWVFMYSGDLDSGRMELLTTVTEDYNVSEQTEGFGTIRINNISSITNITGQNYSCEIGNENNPQMFKVVFENGNFTNYCFTNFSYINPTTYDVSGNYYYSQTITQQRTVEKWIDITNLIEYMGKNLNNQGQSYYKVRNVLFNNGTEYKTKWTYTPKGTAKKGKWSILGYFTETGLINAIENNQYLFIDPWWDSDWKYKKEITNLSGEYPTFNISYDVDMESDFDDLRFLNSSEDTELNFSIVQNSSSSYATIVIDSQNTSSVYMYFGNNAVSTTENGSILFYNAISYYPFNGNAQDKNKINDGSVSGAIQGTGHINNGYVFDGTNDVITVSDDNSLDFGSGAFSYSMWLDFDDGFATTRGIFSKHDGSDFGFYIRQYSLDSGTVNWYLKSANGKYVNAKVTNMDTYNGYNHFVFVYDGNSNGKIYINGVEKTSQAGTGAMDSTDTAVDLLIGKWGTNYFDGKIDEFIIIPKELSVHEVNELYSMSVKSAIFGDKETDNQPPIVNLISPPNNTIVNSNGYSASFIATVYDSDSETDIDNCTLKVWNVSDDTLKYTITNTSIINNTNVTFVQTLMSSNYSWNVHCYDNQSLEGFNATNWTINVIAIPDNAPNIEYGTGNPEGDYTTSPQSFTFNFTNVSDDIRLANISLYINSVLNQTNNSGINNTDYLFDLTFNDGYYEYYGIATDNESQSTQTTTKNFTIDSISPVINITSPTDGFNVTQYNQTIDLNWTLIETNPDTCWYNFDYKPNYLDVTSPTLGDTKYYTFRNNTLSATSGDFRTDTFFGGNGSTIVVGTGTAIGWTTPTTIDNCDSADYSNKAHLSLTANVGKYFCMKDENSNENLFYIFDKWTLKGSYVKTINNVTCSDNHTTINYPTSNPDNVTITLYAQDEVGLTSNDSVTIYKSTQEPIINVTSPLDSYMVLLNNKTFNLNWTISNVTELDSCWYDYNNTITTVTCEDGTTTFNYEENVNNLTFYANDTLNNQNNDKQNWSIFILDYLNYTIDSNITQGIIQTISAIYNFNQTSNIDSVDLNYGGTLYSASLVNIDSENDNMSVSFLSPLTGIVNLGFQVNLINGSIIYLLNHTQSIDNITLDDCTTNNYTVLTTNMFDERDLFPINGTVEVNLLIYPLDSSVLIYNISAKAQDLHQASLCSNVLLNESNYLFDLEIRYFKTNYSAELYHIQKSNSNNAPYNISLYDLAINQSTEFIMTYRDDNYAKRTNVLLMIERKYIDEGIFRTVEIPITSTDSTAYGNFDTDNYKYRITVTYNGEVLNVFDNPTIICESELSGICNIDLSGFGNPNPYKDLEGIRNFHYSTTLSDKTIQVQYTIPSGESRSVKITMTQSSPFSDPTVICTQTLISPSGSLSCNATDTIGDSQVLINIETGGDIFHEVAYYQENLNDSFLLNNYILASLLIILLITMMVSSPKIMVSAGMMSVVLLAFMFLIKGSSVGLILGAVSWLIVSGLIILAKINQKDET